MPRSAIAITFPYRFMAAILLGMATAYGTAALAQQPRPEHWDPATASTLVAYIERIGSHGLDPSNYQAAALKEAIRTGDPVALEKQATASFGLVAEDLAIGHVQPDRRSRYYIAPNSLDPVLVARMIDMAITAHQVSWVLDSFAPHNPEYISLRAALAGPDGAKPAKRVALMASLERWRWFPHNAGSRYLLVNIPEYRLQLIEDGKSVASHKVIVGKVGKQTPQFQALVTGVILNPSWNVPPSIIAESVGKLVRSQPGTARSRGYTWSYRAGHLEVVQRPGPANSLGQMKLDMPNPLTVFIHDTPSKELFDRRDRTFSHGCIRTQYPFDLAHKLLADVGWDRARIDAVLAKRITTRVALSSPLPAYVVYMTAVPQSDGTIAYLKDPYKLDAALAEKLN